MSKAKMICLAGLVAAVAIALWAFHARRNARPASGGNTVTFYGKVIDGDGAPVARAVVTVSVDWDAHGTLPMIAATDYTGAKSQTLHLTTDGAGRFSVVDVPGDQLTVLDVKAPGYAWLIDAAWVPGSKYALHDNRLYTYTSYPVYQPDPDRPAVFPLIASGAANLQPTSRGGSQQMSGGSLLVNEPWTPIIPSAGPNAPSTPAEVQERIAELFSRTPTTRSVRVP